jgi:hypothetical protein
MDCLWNLHMHKTSLLSKDVSDVHELCQYFLNDHLFCIYLFFHDVIHIPLVLSLIHSFLDYATYLIFASLEHLFDFTLSSTSRCFLCNYAFLSSSFS